MEAKIIIICLRLLTAILGIAMFFITLLAGVYIFFKTIDNRNVSFVVAFVTGIMLAVFHSLYKKADNYLKNL